MSTNPATLPKDLYGMSAGGVLTDYRQRLAAWADLYGWTVVRAPRQFERCARLLFDRRHSCDYKCELRDNVVTYFRDWRYRLWPYVDHCVLLRQGAGRYPQRWGLLSQPYNKHVPARAFTDSRYPGVGDCQAGRPSAVLAS